MSEKWPRLALIAATSLGVGSFTVYFIYNGKEEGILSLVGLRNVLLALGIGYIGYRVLKHVGMDANSDDSTSSWEEKKDEIVEKAEEMATQAKESLEAKKDAVWQTLREKYVSKDMDEAFDFVRSMMSKLADFSDLNRVEFKSNPFILLALLMRAQYDKEKQWLASLAVLDEIDETQIEKLRRHQQLSEFAINVYEASSKESREEQARIMGINESDIVMVHFDEDEDSEHFEGCPNFIVFVDHDNSEVVMAIRGTISLADVVIDVVCDDQEFLRGYAHRGILKAAKKLMSVCKSVLSKTMDSHPDYKLVLTGHSLGAGAAILMTMSLLDESKDWPVCCAAIAPPPVYRSDEDLGKDVFEVIDIYINEQDCIPRVSVASIAGLLVSLRAIDDLDLSHSDQARIIAGFDKDQDDSEEEQKKEACIDHIQKVLESSKQERFAFLEHPGRIHHFCRRSLLSSKDDDKNDHISLFKHEGEDEYDDVVVVRQESLAFTRQLLLMRRMVADHLRGGYRRAFEKALCALKS